MKSALRIALPAARQIVRGALRCGLVIAACLAVPPPSSAAEPRFVAEVPAAGQGEWIKCDLQRRFSDPDLTVLQYLARAAEAGCGVVVAAPQHSTHDPETLGRFLTELDSARSVYPKLVVLPAFTWIFRAAGESSRITLILPPGDDLAERLTALPSMLIEADSETTSASALAQSLEKLCPADKPDVWPIVIFDHLRDERPLHDWAVEPHAADTLWRSKPGVAAIGQIGLLDRWDATAIRSGGGWDQLLQSGWNAWAAADTLAFLRERTGLLRPGTSSATWLRLPEFTPEAAFATLQRGAFFGLRGSVAREVELTVAVNGLPRSAHAGETIDVPIGSVLRVQLTLIVPAVDARNRPQRLDGIQLIEVTPTESRIVKKIVPDVGRVIVDYETVVPEGGILFRATGYRIVEGSSDEGFYTNPIRVVAAGKWERPATVVPPEPTLQDYRTIGLVLFMLVLSFGSVIGWLAYSGKLTLLVGDSLEPIERLWKSSRLRRNMHRAFPSMAKHADGGEVIGASLSDSELQWLQGVLVAGTAVIGGLIAGSLDMPWPAAASDRTIRFVIGGATGGMFGALCRWHPGFGVWLFFLLKLLAVLTADARFANALPLCVAATLLGQVVHHAFRTSAIRWPINYPFEATVAVMASLAASIIVAGAWPNPPTWLLTAAGLVAMGVWFFGNRLIAQSGIQLFATISAVGLWFGATLLDPGQPHSLTGLTMSLVEATAVGLMWNALRLERLDVAGQVLTITALALVSLQIFSPDYAPAAGMLAAVAACGAIFLATSDAGWWVRGSASLAVVCAIAALLFDPVRPGFLLCGALAAVAAAAAGRHPFRTLLFAAPYVVFGGILSALAIVQPESASFQQVWPLVWQREVMALKPPMLELDAAHIAGQAFCFTGLIAGAVLAAAFHRGSGNDEFDAARRSLLSGAIFAGGCWWLQIPVPATVWLLLAAMGALWPPGVRQELAAVDPKTFAAEEASARSYRRRLAAAATVVAALIAYGSLVPFAWREVPWDLALRDFEQRFLGIIWPPKLNSDRLVNLMLGVPLGFLTYGSFVFGAKRLRDRLLAAPEALQLCLAISLGVEFAQYWSAGRVSSPWDVIAQGIGAAVGIGLWSVIGEVFLHRWAESRRELSREARWALLLFAYWVVLLIFAVLPVTLPATSPRFVLIRYRDGLLSLVPFAGSADWTDLAKDFVVGVVMFLPIGIWGATAFHKPGVAKRTLWSAAANGFAVVVLITVLRSLASTKATDPSWLLTGLIGCVLGAAGWRIAKDRGRHQYGNWKLGLAWSCAAAILAVVIVVQLLFPLTFDVARESALERARTFLGVPFVNFHSGNDWLLIEQVVRKLGWFIALGMVLGQAVIRGTESQSMRVVLGVLAFLVGAAIGAGIEIAQLFQTHRTPDSTDVLIYVVGVAIGLWIRGIWMDDERSPLFQPINKSTNPLLVTPVNTWNAAVQTIIALGLAIGVLVALAVLLLCR